MMKTGCKVLVWFVYKWAVCYYFLHGFISVTYY